MAPESCTTCQSFCVNTPADLAGELDELTSVQGQTKRFNVGSDKAPTKAYTPPEDPTPSLVLPSAKDLITKFMKVFMEMM